MEKRIKMVRKTLLVESRKGFSGYMSISKVRRKVSKPWITIEKIIPHKRGQNVDGKFIVPYFVFFVDNK
jgi:hypothetical protein